MSHKYQNRSSAATASVRVGRQAMRRITASAVTVAFAAISTGAFAAMSDAEFIARANAVINDPRLQTEQNVAALEAAYKEMGQASNAVYMVAGRLRPIRIELDEKACPVIAQKAGLPAPLIGSQFVNEINSMPVRMSAIVCTASKRGIPFQFNTKGMLSKDSFELKGQRQLKVIMSRDVSPDGQNVLFIPEEAVVNGKNFKITRGNLVELNQVLMQALQ